MSTRTRVAAQRLREGSPQKVGMSSARLKNAVTVARQLVEDKVGQTIEIMVARRGIIVLHEVFGKLTPEPNSPKTLPLSIFPLASITKLLTATALMILVEEGRVGLNRPVSTYIPEFKGEGKAAVLVRHLLTHTSGLNEDELEKYAREQQDKIPVTTSDATIHPLLHRYYTIRYGAPLWKSPGTEMSYCNYNYELAGEIVRRETGMGLDIFAKSKIFRPIGMVDTYYCRKDAPVQRRVRRPPEVNPLISPEFHTLWIAQERERIYLGAGSALSTVLDTARFGQMFLNGGIFADTRILSPISVAEMTRNQIPGIKSQYFGEFFPEASWGLGWSIHGNKTGTCGGLFSINSFEMGGYGGVYIWVDPDLEIVGVYFSSVPDSPDASLQSQLKYWHSDLFTDAVTAAVEKP